MSDEFTLRPMTADDLELVLTWRNSDRVRTRMYSSHIISRDEHRRWFERSTSDPDSHHLIFEHDSRPMGVVNIRRVDPAENACVWGFYLGEMDVPRGTGTAMGIMALNFIFDSLGMHKTVGEMLSSNEESIRFHRRLGFSETDRFGKRVGQENRREEVISMALFDFEWRRIRSTLMKKYLERSVG